MDWAAAPVAARSVAVRMIEHAESFMRVLPRDLVDHDL
jgi:hypothetical protein